MSGPTPITAGFRIEFQLVVNGILRRIHQLCDAVPSSGSTMGFALVGLPAFGNAPAENCIDQFYTDLAPNYNVGTTTFGEAFLQQFNPADGSYSTVASRNTPVTPTSSAINQLGFQTLFLAYVPGRKKVELKLPENTAGGLLRTTNLAAAAIIFGALPTHWVTPASADQEGNWVKSRGDGSPVQFISVVVGSNRRYRRERGLA